ncbi:MAG TPA: helix-turn-helix transcriptional regulator [Dehalococcoidia bacterium]|nr:helix-turn-helix transcriptional regulator [Dehalococcoidia bacterium]
MTKVPQLAQLLTDLRTRAGLSLREVEQRTGGVVSNVYLSQLEHGRRTEPNPRILVALARVYGRPVGELFEAAGYVDAPSATEVDVAFEQVIADPKFQFGTRFKGELDQASKRAIIELYESATNKRLLKGEGE